MALLQLQKDKQVIVSLHEGEKVNHDSVNVKANTLVVIVRGVLCKKCHILSFQIVKFCQPGQERVSPLSDVDIGVYQLQRSEKLLGERVQKLSLEADRYGPNINF